MLSFLVVKLKISQWHTETSMLNSKNSAAGIFLLALTNMMTFSG
jgi:hypothetical protein